MNKKRIFPVVTALSLTSLLSTSKVDAAPIEKDTTTYEESIDKNQGLFSIPELDLISVSDTLGNKKYYFVNLIYDSQKGDWKYQSITKPNLDFEKGIPILKETEYYWIPDSTYPVSLINLQEIVEMSGYDPLASYTIGELEMMEETFSSFNFNPYLYLQDVEFSIDNILIVGNGENVSIYDRNYCLALEENVNNEVRTELYFYNLMNFKKGLKCNCGITLEEEQILRSQNDYSYMDTIYIEKETSLCSWNTLKENDFTVYNAYDYLNEEQIERGYIYYYEIEELIKNTSSFENEEIVLLALNR